MRKVLLKSFLSLLFLWGVAFAQTRAVTGTVLSAQDGSPLVGVTVTLQGTTTMTLTNESGNYSINAPANGSLIFSYTGFNPVTQAISNRTTVNVELTASVSSLDEVVVVGYGTVKKSDFTGSAVAISDKDIDKRPITNVLTALQGSGPGVQTAAPSGGPGSSPTVRIRGIGSYSASSVPLYVVDGVEYMGGMANINPEDVESITVLKDAATIAIFGSRGANGVVMITTKKGTGKKSSFGGKVQFGFNKNGVPNYNTVSPGEYYELMWEAYKNSLHFGNAALPLDVASQIASGKYARNSAGKQVYNGVVYDDIVEYLGNYNAFNVANSDLVSVDGKLNPSARLLYANDLNWLDQASRSGKRNEYGVNFSGGTDRTDVYASLNYLQEEGWGLRSSIDRIAARVNVNTKVTDWLKTGVNVFANQNKYNNASTGASSIVNPFYFSRGIGPIYPVHLHDPVTGQFILDDKGQKIFDLGNMVADYGLSRPFNSGRHAIAENLWNIDRSSRDFIGARAYIELDLLPWLSVSTNLSPEITNVRNEDYQNTIVGDGAPAGRYAQDWNRRFGYTFNQLVNISKKFTDHNMAAVLGHESVSSQYESIAGRRTGQGFDDFLTFSNFADILTLSSGLTEYALESYFSRLNYDYQSKYYLSGSVRYDGDSKMPKVNRWSYFWSIGGAWRIENEKFFRSNLINQLKLRASYGRLGNNDLGDDIGVYPYQPGYGIGENNAAAPGAVLTSLGSPMLRWEGQTPLDIGVDFSMLQGRLFGTIDVYDRRGDGLLFNVRQPYHNGGTTSGSYSIYKNVGNISNKGIEVSLTGGLIRKQDLNWNMTFNISSVKNKLTKMPVETPEIVSSPYKRAVGKSIYEYFTRSFYGVDPDNGRVLYKGIKEGTYDAANQNIKIIGKDTLTYDQNLANQDWIGKSALPKVYGSLINSLSYKGFNLEFVITYSMGGWAMDGQYDTYMNPGPSNGANLHRDLFNGWRKPGDKTNIPRMELDQAIKYNATSDRFLTKSDYINLSAVNVSYDLPKQFVERATLKSARVFVSAENLWFSTARKGFNTLNSLTSGASTSSYNLAKTINFGINFTF